MCPAYAVSRDLCVTYKYSCMHLVNGLLHHGQSVADLGDGDVTTGKFHQLKEILSLTQISTENKYWRLILKLHSPKEPVY